MNYPIIPIIMATGFEIDDLVWAKMKGFPAWPGKIIEPKPEVKKPANNKKVHHFVFFFGSENYAWIPEENVYLYSDHRDKFKLSKRIPKGFKEALEAIEDELKEKPFIVSRLYCLFLALLVQDQKSLCD
ncbi:cytokine-like nuclear factor N-PAC, partial [Saccostrea cucullata]|uniref:cytokine-like nuclear factor N-PAC n=1 Tax=Saccostrea cuccullata TaxID=36930 RepID=UPI002ED0ADD8